MADAGILKTKFLALLELRRFDEAATITQAFLTNGSMENRTRVEDDVVWVADKYIRAGRRDAAIAALRAERDKFIKQSLDTQRLDTALEAATAE